MFLFSCNLMFLYMISILEVSVYIYLKNLNWGMGFYCYYRYYLIQRLEFFLSKFFMKLNFIYKILLFLIMKVKKCFFKKKLLFKCIIKLYVNIVNFYKLERNMVIFWKMLNI